MARDQVLVLAANKPPIVDSRKPSANRLRIVEREKSGRRLEEKTVVD